MAGGYKAASKDIPGMGGRFRVKPSLRPGKVLVDTHTMTSPFPYPDGITPSNHP